jgi:hypothetical protein
MPEAYDTITPFAYRSDKRQAVGLLCVIQIGPMGLPGVVLSLIPAPAGGRCSVGAMVPGIP